MNRRDVLQGLLASAAAVAAPSAAALPFDPRYVAIDLGRRPAFLIYESNPPPGCSWVRQFFDGEFREEWARDEDVYLGLQE